MAPHVLVADDDAWILRMVATVLEKRGYSVETAVDGEDALQRALARTPDLLITDVMMPKMDGWSLVRQLRSHAELAMLPVIFLTALSSEDDRIRGFRLGADDYVTKPFRFEELDLRVAKTLRRAQQTQQDTREQLSGSGLRGDLSQVGLSSLLVLIEMERKTGLLQMRAPGGPSGQILVREGKVVHARLDEQEDPVDAECVYYMLTWGAGEFEFIACVVEGVDRVTVSTTHLLMEGARLMDEANEPSLQPAVTIPPRISQEFPAVQPDADESPAAASSSSSVDTAATSSADGAASSSADGAATSSADGAATSSADSAASEPASASGAANEGGSTSGTSSQGASTSGESSAAFASSRAASSAGTLSSMWTLTGDDSVQVDETSSINETPSRDHAAKQRVSSRDMLGAAAGGPATPSPADTNDAPTVIPGSPPRASSPVIPTTTASEANDAPTVIPGLPTRASSPAFSDAAGTKRPSSPSMSDASRSKRPSSPSVADASGSKRPSSPSVADASTPARASSPAISSASETSRASSPSLSETSRSSSPAIPPIPTLPTRKSTPAMPADKPASASGPMAAVVDDPSDDWE